MQTTQEIQYLILFVLRTLENRLFLYYECVLFDSTPDFISGEFNLADGNVSRASLSPLHLNSFFITFDGQGWVFTRIISNFPDCLSCEVLGNFLSIPNFAPRRLREKVVKTFSFLNPDS